MSKEGFTLKNWTEGACRDGFGKAILDIASYNKRIFALSADLADSTRLSAFARRFPERFVQTGVAEQNMLGIAAGLAASGKIPFAASFAVFSPGRNWDQLRVSVCYSNLNVKIIGAHAGLNVGPDGASHQALEDIAITRVLPNLTVIAPVDEAQTALATIAAAKHRGPLYIRFGRSSCPNITTHNSEFTIGKAQTLAEGKDVSIVASGPLVAKALLARDVLQKSKISAQVINLHTIKPLDEEALLKAAQKTKLIITAEDHQVNGGMGSAVAELLASKLPTRVIRIGVNDRFGESGKPEELYKKYGLTHVEIVKVVKGNRKR